MAEFLTESDSPHRHLEKMPLRAMLEAINREDQKVPLAVKAALPQIEELISHVIEKMKAGGRLFYIGAGTSGRLGIVDASECPPTFGVAHDRVIAVIAGGDGAIRKAVEFAEDDEEQGWKDLKVFDPTTGDVLIGLAASGNTPYVVGAITRANAFGMLTGGVTCNPGSALAEAARHSVEVAVGPEFITGSTRMKAGTAQKLVLNMISTAAMIALGHVKDNKMVDMQLTNTKLVKRGVKMVMDELGVAKGEAEQLLFAHGSVRKVLLTHKKG